MADFIRDKIDRTLLKPNANNLSYITEPKYRHEGRNQQTKFTSTHSKAHR